MKKSIMVAGLMTMAAAVMAQLPVDGTHYPAGLNGIKGGSLPGPGIYLRDDNWVYYGTGGALPGYKTYEYLQAPQLMWMTDWTIIGANIGMDVEIPIIYRQASHTGPSPTPASGNSTTYSERSGLGDIKIEPLLLTWHWKHFDTTVSYALWVPSGQYSTGYSPDYTANLGDGVWANMISLGGVWYPDEKKTWALSLLHHYEINSAQVGMTFSGSNPGGGYSSYLFEKIPCSTYTVEWSVSKTVLTNTDVGLGGYYQKQFTDGGAVGDAFKNSEVAGIGPEISAVIPGWNLAVSLRYDYEFTAYDRPQGHMVDLTVSKKF